jgi:hypothetical protein
MKRPSQRFSASFWTTVILPVVLVILLLVLLGTLGFVVLFATGLL